MDEAIKKLVWQERSEGLYILVGANSLPLRLLTFQALG